MRSHVGSEIQSFLGFLFGGARAPTILAMAVFSMAAWVSGSTCQGMTGSMLMSCSIARATSGSA
eukprot:310268-Alexandrium_andersonii.AAC.1